MFSGFLDRFHRALARSQIAMTIVRKIQNQCLRIIQCRFGPSAKFHANGEVLLIARLAPALKIVFDVGANVGDWTAEVRRLSACCIHVFECNPQLMGGLEKRFENDEDVYVNPFGMGDIEETRRFQFSARSSELGAIDYVRTWAPGTKTLDVKSVDVQLSTVDEYCNERAIDYIDLLKVDTEGNDFHVLRGARRMIAGRRIRIIQFEYGEGWRSAGATLFHCVEWLKAADYRTYVLMPAGLEDCDLTRWGEFFGYCNCVAIPSDAVENDQLPFVHRELKASR